MTDAIVVAVIGAVPAMITAVVGLVVIKAATRIEVKVDGHLSSLVEAVDKANIAKGVLQEKERSRGAGELS